MNHLSMVRYNLFGGHSIIRVIDTQANGRNRIIFTHGTFPTYNCVLEDVNQFNFDIITVRALHDCMVLQWGHE